MCLFLWVYRPRKLFIFGGVLLHILSRIFHSLQLYLMSLKSKKIEKVSKKGRAPTNKFSQYSVNALRSLVAPKCEPKPRKLEILKSRLKNKKKQSHRPAASEKIVVDLNLGQYGFDSLITKNSVAEIEELVRNCQQFSLNPNMQKVQWKQMCGEITSRLERQNFLIRHQNNSFFYSSQEKVLIEINKDGYVLWQCMHQLFTKIKNGAISPGLSGAITNETQTLRRFLKKSQACLATFTHIEKRKEIETLTEELNFEVAFKTFVEGLKVLSIDMLNYFLMKEFEENSRIGRLENEIKDWDEWADFIQKKRVRLRKANKFLLHTACQLCLSPYSEQSNPMGNCPECHIRGHKLCLGGQKNLRCGRCIYLRLSNQMKLKIPECFICSTKSLAPIKINSSKFAHVFCLMASQLWRIADSTVSYRDPMEKVRNKTEVCIFCKKQAVYYGRCDKCRATGHFICAYMRGATFEMEGGYRVRFVCCELDGVASEKLGEQRKYILNYNNMVFQKQGAIKLSSKKRRKTKNQFRIENSQRLSLAPSDNDASSQAHLHYQNQQNAISSSVMDQEMEN